jgi:hypothetical protein
LEELNARRLNGAITPDTYVIEHSGTPGAPGEWRRYRDVFPTTSYLPPLPAAIPPPAPLIAPAAHPLFPSAAHAPSVPAAFPPAAPHAHYPVRKTNAWCAWGFGLGIAGFLFSFACIGIFLAIPALVICLLGFAQVQKNRAESGRGLAVAGGILAVLGLLISLGLLAYFVPLAIKEHEQTATEQSSTNSE